MGHLQRLWCSRGQDQSGITQQVVGVEVEMHGVIGHSGCMEVRVVEIELQFTPRQQLPQPGEVLLQQTVVDAEIDGVVPAGMSVLLRRSYKGDRTARLCTGTMTQPGFPEIGIVSD